MAVKFENVLKIPARFWLRRQASYDERKVRLKQRKVFFKEEKRWVKAMPYNEMVKLNWIDAASNIEDQTDKLLGFFGFGAHSAWTDYYCNRELKTQFNISLKHTKSDYTTSAWLRQGEIQASQIKASTFNKRKFKERLKTVQFTDCKTRR